MESLVGLGGSTFAGKHPRRVLVIPFRREHAAGEGKAPREILGAQESHQLGSIGGARQRDPGNLVAGQRFASRAGLAAEPVGVSGVDTEDVDDLDGHPADRCFHQLADISRRSAVVGQHVAGGGEMVDGADDVGDLCCAVVIRADGFGDLCQISTPRRRHQHGDVGRRAGRNGCDGAVGDGQSCRSQLAAERLVERRHSVVVEARCNRPEHGQILIGNVPCFSISSDLASHLAQRVERPTTFELVDGDDIGEVQHVDLFQLRRSTELGRHDVQRHIGDIGHGGVTLANAGRLHDDQVVAGGLTSGHHGRELGGDLARRRTGRDGSEEDLRRRDRVHPDAVAEERAASLATGRVDRQHRHPQFVLLIQPEPENQLVGH